MRSLHTLAFMGGDQRGRVAAERLGTGGEGMGYLTHFITSPRDPMLSCADVWVLPTPASGDDRSISDPSRVSEEVLYYQELRGLLGPEHLLIGGKIPPSWRADAEKRGARVVDVTESERLACENALPTAEGALAIALQTMPRTLYGASTLILGFGRIAKRLIPMLIALGARVTVCARSEMARAEAEAMGCEAISFEAPDERMSRFHFICNTVPSLVIGEDLLRLCRSDVLLLDLASRPGGIDRYAAEKLGLTVIWALSLPGKVAPISAGEYLAREIDEQIRAWDASRGRAPEKEAQT